MMNYKEIADKLINHEISFSDLSPDELDIVKIGNEYFMNDILNGRLDYERYLPNNDNINKEEKQ